MQKWKGPPAPRPTIIPFPWSVLIDPEEADAVQLWQLGNEHGEQRYRVDHEVHAVVFGVKAGEDVPAQHTAKTNQ